ncbi:MAG: PDZ domain-containing protein [Deltaproteobacteria bacterium]|nr:PDZ domain-containing protein [Deltaproteobacteria bacterium]
MLDTYFKQYFWTFKLVVIAVAGILTAKAVNTVVAASLRLPASALAAAPPAGATTPAAQSRASQIATQAFLERNVFQAEREVAAAADCACDATPDRCDQGCACDTSCKADPNQCEKSGLRAKLTATVVSEDPLRSVAIFADPTTNEPAGYYAGDKVEQATVLTIEWRKVKVDNGGHCEFFSIEEDQPGEASTVASLPPPSIESGGGPDESKIALGEGVKKVKETEYEIPRGEIDNVLSNLNAVATQARIVPSFQNGKANGFKLFSIRPNSLYSKIGIQNGDIIQKINGYEINSPDKALEIYSKLKDATSITVDLIRRGKTQTMSYNIR